MALEFGKLFIPFHLYLHMREDGLGYLALDEPGEGDLVGEEVRLDEVPPLGAHDVGGLQVGRREVQEDGGENVGHVQQEQVVELHRRKDIPPAPPVLRFDLHLLSNKTKFHDFRLKFPHFHKNLLLFAKCGI